MAKDRRFMLTVTVPDDDMTDPVDVGAMVEMFLKEGFDRHREEHDQEWPKKWSLVVKGRRDADE
jgi:hypothetical protein